MFDKNKSMDKENAIKILEKVTPTPTTPKLYAKTDSEKVELITEHFKDIMDIIGLDLTDDSLSDTPKRLAKMYVNELFAGLKPENFPKCTVIDNKMKVDQMVVEKNIKVMSVCEHHFTTIHGRAHVAYIPKDKVIGLSKINRIVDYFCRRPQVQERLTKQIADALKAVLETEDVAVYIDSKHYCVISRGIQDQNSSTVTSCLSGYFFKDPSCKAEFLKICDTK